MSYPPVRAQRASLWPREHGAYVQLLGPLLIALFFVRPSATTLTWAVMVVCLFLLHEPVMLLLGRRGERAKAELGFLARHRAEWLGVVAAVTGFGGLTQASWEAALWFVVSLGFALLSARFLFAKQERTVRGQLVVGVALASFTMPMLVSSAVPSARALCLTGTLALTHALGCITARGVIYRKQDAGRLLHVAAFAAFLAALLLGLVHRSVMPLAWSLAPLPFAGIAGALALGLFSPRSPKPVGWALTAASCVAMLLFGWGFAGSG
ncbi:MAG: YwiC-like family protein [Myxococcales bacterium]